MSTKCSLAQGEQFHLYSEVFDSEHVFLEIEGCKFEAENNRIMVEIPIAIWEVIRQHSLVDFSLVNKTDQELQEEVERLVQERIEEYTLASEKKKIILGLQGFLSYGPVENAKEKQISDGVEFYRNLRSHQANMKQEIERLQHMQIRDDESN